MKMPISPTTFIFFFFNDTATTEIYTLSLHDALPISKVQDEPGRPISFEETGTVATQIPGVGVTAHSSNGGYHTFGMEADPLGPVGPHRFGPAAHAVAGALYHFAPDAPYRTTLQREFQRLQALYDRYLPT